MGALLKYGIVCDVDASIGKVRVKFEEDSENEDNVALTSKWMPLCVPGTLANKYSFPLDVNQHVACMMEDAHCENGVVIGAIYNSTDKPDSGASKDKQRVKFEDGSIVEYNRSNGEYLLDMKGKVTIKSGDKIIHNSGSNAGLIKIAAHLADINDFKTDINTLKALMAAWVVVPNDGGAALKAILATWVGDTIALSTQSNLENPNVTH